jgi:hypothetical protein
VDWIQVTGSQGPSDGMCHHGNIPSGYVKGRRFFDMLGDYNLFKISL